MNLNQKLDKGLKNQFNTSSLFMKHKAPEHQKITSKTQLLLMIKTMTTLQKFLHAAHVQKLVQTLFHLQKLHRSSPAL